MSSLLRGVVREPLLHFVLAGAAIFGLDALMRSDEGGNASEDRRIVVDAGVRTELVDGWTHAHGAPPSADELEAMIARWIDDEVLYREGLARELDRDDPRVRAQVASSMGYVLESGVIVAAPSDGELRAFFDAHRERWSEQALVSFTHVFVEGSDEAALARATELSAQLRAGASPSGLGDTFSGGRRYRRRQVAQLAESFGDEFARGIDAQREGEWALRTSRFGLHVVRIDERSAARDADFERVRGDVLHAWSEEHREVAVREAMARLRARWEITRADSEAAR